MSPIEHDVLSFRGAAWKKQALLSYAKVRATTAGHLVSTSVLANIVAYATDPSRFQDFPLARNTVEKYKRIWEEILNGGTTPLNQIEDAFEAYLQGDDSLFKALMPNRDQWVLVEIGRYMEPNRFGQTVPLEWRARKFHNPMYLTPAGIIQAFPETDEDSFIDYEMAHLSIKRYQEMLPEGSTFRISSLKRGRQIHPSAYRRWVRDVKGVGEYKEVRRDLRESFDIYTIGGTAALKNLYSPGYVFMLLRKFNQEGWLQSPPTLIT